MKRNLIKLLLTILNSRFLNQSPCEYGYIGNVDAFSYGHLKSEEAARPGITVAVILAEADAFKTCPIRLNGLTVIENGEAREGTVWDVHELRQRLAAEPEPRPVAGVDSSPKNKL